jgi:integrase/DNA-directed RNA polymerase subunit RPC12/RpoP
MAINYICKKCKTAFSLTHKKCPHCGEPIPRAGKTYRVRVQVNGKRITRTVPNSLELAREIEAKIKSELVSGDYFNRHTKIPTIDDIWNKYFDIYKAQGKAYTKEKNRYDYLLYPRFGKKTLDKITVLDVQKLITDMRNTKTYKGTPYSAKTINNAVELLSRLFNFAINQGLYTGSNPCKMAKKPKVNNIKNSYLSEGELKSLLAVLDNYNNQEVANIIRVLLFTGMRFGEVAKLEWQDIDFDRGFIHIRNPKGGKDETLPMNHLAIKALKGQLKYKRQDSELIFPAKNNKPRTSLKAWYAIKEQAGIAKDFRLHDLRHTFASLLASSGKVDIYTLQKLMTHKTPQMTQRYAHLIEGALKQGAEALVDILSDNVVEADFKKEAK